MRYISTRGQTDPLSFTEAVATGLAPDGGLLVPESLPDLSAKLPEWQELSYPELCEAFFKVFATDLDSESLRARVQDAYRLFTHPEIAPLRQLDENLYVLELFHGPTLAFKDFALQLLGGFYAEQIKRTGQPIRVLGATSGDTGAAAIHGLLGQAGVQIFILYPDGKVAPLQERQMTCTGASNVFALAVDGSFDDAQTAIKDVFGDLTFRREFHLSAINSINLARVLAQCVYYLYAWFRLPPAKRRQCEFVVPTGNFGNVLAGWLMYRMGMSVAGFKVATNQNDILYRMFTSGEYSVSAVQPSFAPSMDIQIASNFERLLFYREGCDPSRVRAIMSGFRKTGRHVFNDFDNELFTASRSDDTSIRRNIQSVYQRYNYVVDPHTACGFQDLNPTAVNVVLATAHPAKFPDVIRETIGVDATHPSLEALKHLPISKHLLKPTTTAIKEFITCRSE